VSHDPRLDLAGGNRRRLAVEVVLVLAIAFGASTVSSLITIVNRATLPIALSQQTATINRSVDDRPIFDLLYQLSSLTFGLAPAALALFLIWRSTRPHFGAIGLDGTRVRREVLWGVGLAAAIGVPGLGLYLASRALNLSVTVVPTALDAAWWTLPILILAAARAAVLEEVVVLGYLLTRLRTLGWSMWPAIFVSSVVRGSYHLYQGYGAFIGNVAMGIAFGWLYEKTGRLWPFLVAHFAIDLVVFVGFPFAAAWWPGLFGLPA
jgi:membrane protease YdiL (CAAX protease family)